MCFEISSNHSTRKCNGAVKDALLECFCVKTFHFRSTSSHADGTLQYRRCQRKMKDKGYIESRWGDFSCSGFTLISPSEGTINANKYNTILCDYFHPFGKFLTSWIPFFLSQMTESVSAGRERSVNSSMSLKTMLTVHHSQLSNKISRV